MKKKMNAEELISFLQEIAQPELYEEIEDIRRLEGFRSIGRYPNYLKGVIIALKSLGYDRSWVDSILYDVMNFVFLDIPLNEKDYFKDFIEKLETIRKEDAHV